MVQQDQWVLRGLQVTLELLVHKDQLERIRQFKDRLGLLDRRDHRVDLQDQQVRQVLLVQRVWMERQGRRDL